MTMLDLSWLHSELDVTNAIKELKETTPNNDNNNDEQYFDFLAISFHGVLKAHDLAFLLRKMPELEKLVITEVDIDGDLTEVADAFANLHQLVAVELDFRFVGDDALFSIPYVGDALSKLDLQSLRIHHKMTLLLSSLVLDADQLNVSEMTLMFDKQVSDADLSRCLAIVEKSKTLKALKLGGLYGPHELNSQASIQALGHLIAKNQSLVKLEVGVGLKASLVPVATGLKHNTTLETLCCDADWSPNPHADLVEMSAFWDTMMYHNFTLRKLRVKPFVWAHGGDKVAQHMSESINFLCAMNGCRNKASGMAFRQKMVDESNASIINDLLDCFQAPDDDDDHHHHPSTSSNHVSVVFFHLQLNPALWLQQQMMMMAIQKD